MDIKKDLEVVIGRHKDDMLLAGQTNISAMGEDCLAEIKRLEKELLKYKAKESRNRKEFDYILGATKKGNKFIKIIYESYEANGWIEIARIHLSKNEWVQNAFGIEDILGELKQ